jgi:hypothetical protein
VLEPPLEKLSQRCLARLNICSTPYRRNQAGTFILRLALGAPECSPLADAFALGISAMIDGDQENAGGALMDGTFHSLPPFNSVRDRNLVAVSRIALKWFRASPQLSPRLCVIPRSAWRVEARRRRPVGAVIGN